MKRLLVVALLAAAALAAPAAPAVAEEAIRIAFHIDENDPKRMNLVLNNARNVKKHYDSEGRGTRIEIVAYGPGLHMLRADTSPVKDRISAMALEMDGLTFAACGNTMAKMEETSGKPVPLVDEAGVVPSGVVRLVELQMDGWAYIRP